MSRAPRILQLAAAAAGGAVLSAGGYALAASNRAPAGHSPTITFSSDRALPTPPAPIHACADRGGAHLLHLQARCNRGQQSISWDSAAAGSPIRAWGFVGPDGTIASGQGAAVRNTGIGVYQISVSAPSCSRAVNNAPIVTVNDSNPPGGVIGSSFPYAWAWSFPSGEQGFTVYTGVIVNGAFQSVDMSFDFEDSCR
jgi:hypothetical protein